MRSAEMLLKRNSTIEHHVADHLQPGLEIRQIESALQQFRKKLRAKQQSLYPDRFPESVNSLVRYSMASALKTIIYAFVLEVGSSIGLNSHIQPG